jgi:hypothetical protein
MPPPPQNHTPTGIRTHARTYPVEDGAGVEGAAPGHDVLEGSADRVVHQLSLELLAAVGSWCGCVDTTSARDEATAHARGQRTGQAWVELALMEEASRAVVLPACGVYGCVCVLSAMRPHNGGPHAPGVEARALALADEGVVGLGEAAGGPYYLVRAPLVEAARAIHLCVYGGRGEGGSVSVAKLGGPCAWSWPEVARALAVRGHVCVNLPCW